MQETKDPSSIIKLFGHKISFPTDSAAAISSKDLSSPSMTEESDQYSIVGKEIETEQFDAMPDFDTEDSRNPETVPESNVNPDLSVDEETGKLKGSEIKKEQSDSLNSQEKMIKKPDKILPCPRCNSMDTKFCYYNNYNVSQPRHFCKACQRYWTAGGTMRNVPVGAGRRKNKNSASHYHHITIPEAFQAVTRIDSPIGAHHHTAKNNGRVLGFSIDAPACDSMASAIKLSEQKVLNTQNGPHNFEEQGVRRVHQQGGENGDDCSSGSTVTVSTNSMDEGGKNCIQEPLIQNLNGFPSQIPCLSGVPWHYPWNAAVPSPAFCPPGFPPMSFYPTAYWNCDIPGTWSIPLLPPQASLPNQKTPSSVSNSTTLGKHSRDVEMIKADNSEEQQPSKQNSGYVLVPKTLRIDDPSEAAKSSIWTTLGIRNELSSGGGLFKAFQSKGDKKHHTSETSQVLQANPAALCRSSNFRERA